MIHIFEEDFGDIISITMSGTLSRDSLMEAEESWSELMAKKPQLLAFNLKDLTQIDSVAINHLFKLAKIASEKNVRLVIYDVNESLGKILEVIKLDQVIPIVSRKQFELEYLKNR